MLRVFALFDDYAQKMISVTSNSERKKAFVFFDSSQLCSPSENVFKKLILAMYFAVDGMATAIDFQALLRQERAKAIAAAKAELQPERSSESKEKNEAMESKVRFRVDFSEIYDLNYFGYDDRTTYQSVMNFMINR
jgi:hypothetical protein